MHAKFRTLNEDRGARRADDLRRRFSHVSGNAARSAPGRGSPAQARVLNRSHSAQLAELLSWGTLATVMVFIGFLII